MAKLPVAILGATGAVGQRFVQLLDGHPWFEIAALAASERSAGRRYADVCRWVIPGDPPPSVGDMIVIVGSFDGVYERVEIRVTKYRSDFMFNQSPNFLTGCIQFYCPWHRSCS